MPTDLILCCSSRCTPEQVVHTKVLKSRTTYWLPRLSQSKQPRFSGFRWLSLRILLYLRRFSSGLGPELALALVFVLDGDAELRGGVGGVGGGGAVEGGFGFGLDGWGCRWGLGWAGMRL
jgi:hypothetical protein